MQLLIKNRFTRIILKCPQRFYFTLKIYSPYLITISGPSHFFMKLTPVSIIAS
jgi:hypothetical protein